MTLKEKNEVIEDYKRFAQDAEDRGHAMLAEGFRRALVRFGRLQVKEGKDS